MSDEGRVAPWHCGSQFADWLARNCERCAKFDPNRFRAPSCEIDAGIGEAMLEGDMPRDLALRLGWREDVFPLTWDCPERVTV